MPASQIRQREPSASVLTATTVNTRSTASATSARPGSSSSVPSKPPAAARPRPRGRARRPPAPREPAAEVERLDRVTVGAQRRAARRASSAAARACSSAGRGQETTTRPVSGSKSVETRWVESASTVRPSPAAARAAAAISRGAIPNRVTAPVKLSSATRRPIRRTPRPRRACELGDRVREHQRPAGAGARQQRIGLGRTVDHDPARVGLDDARSRARTRPRTRPRRPRPPARRRAGSRPGGWSCTSTRRAYAASPRATRRRTRAGSS